MSDPYQYWKDRQVGLEPKIFMDDPKCGFYRKGIYARGFQRDGVFVPDEKGNMRRIGWEPVAIYQVITARIGDREVTGDHLNQLWTHIADNDISEATYRAVAERGEPWPAETKSKGKFA